MVKYYKITFWFWGFRFQKIRNEDLCIGIPLLIINWCLGLGYSFSISDLERSIPSELALYSKRAACWAPLSLQTPAKLNLAELFHLLQWPTWLGWYELAKTVAHFSRQLKIGRWIESKIREIPSTNFEPISADLMNDSLSWCCIVSSVTLLNDEIVCSGRQPVLGSSFLRSHMSKNEV